MEGNGDIDGGGNDSNISNNGCGSGDSRRQEGTRQGTRGGGERTAAAAAEATTATRIKTKATAVATAAWEVFMLFIWWTLQEISKITTTCNALDDGIRIADEATFLESCMCIYSLLYCPFNFLLTTSSCFVLFSDYHQYTSPHPFDRCFDAIGQFHHVPYQN